MHACAAVVGVLLLLPAVVSLRSVGSSVDFRVVSVAFSFVLKGRT